MTTQASSNADPIIVIGAGLAGYNLVKELRKLGCDQPIQIICADDGRNYSKPMLSTGFSKNKSADELAMASAADMAEQLNIVVRNNTRVTGIDTDAHRIFIGQEPVAYSKLVLAWGAGVIEPRLAGDGGERIFSINDLQDYSRFRAAAEGKKKVVVMGAGLIGMEYANDLAAGGFDIDVVAPGDQALPALLPKTAADAVQNSLEQLGVRFHIGPVVSRVDNAGDGVQVTLSNGEVIAADLVVSAIGLRPRLDLAVKAGLKVNRGVVTDRQLQTSAADVYALGDCAEVCGHVLLYVMPLMTCSRALAKTLNGTPTEVVFGAMPVTVKTPALPVVVAVPADENAGSWQIESDGNDVQAEFRAENGELLGYALTGARVMNKVALNKALPAIMP